ncbi:energy transducer TonB [Flavobacterium sp. 17A]|uniref:Energy transducer TonB n=1 Tax=Flavobacterium potami TaxID=2872310 RepID=A0A9X1KR46_9FLAO|nr:energy transducer TonB [Flavobacterium potami]MBZ4036175.1 energy transducer TonB [Flavobacterium potami]
MERNLKITIPEPCQENWDKMTPNENGRFCLSCSKTVIDFTTMLPEEIKHFFIQNENEKVCGRFRKSQLDSITIQIPSKVLYSQTNYHKMFLLALFVAMGTTLFSCADKDGKKKKIDTIEVVGLSDQDETPSSCYGHEIESKREKTKQKKSEELTVLGAILPPDYIKTGSFSYDIIYHSTDLDVAPVPESGMKKFDAFFIKNYVTPKDTEDFRGRAFVIFVIEKDGSLSNFNIVKNTPKAIGEEAIRILKTGSNWIPGKLKNQIVRSTYVLPIRIK